MNITVVALQFVCCDPHLHITSLDGHAIMQILLNMHSMQWRILILRAGVAGGYTVWHSVKPHFQIRSCHCLCELEKFCKTGMFKVRY
jgi:hypothetical protein